MARLRWSLDNPGAGRVIQGYRMYGVEVPKSLMPPGLSDIEWTYWHAFGELHTDRREGGAIPGSVIREYARSQSGSDPDVFHQIMRVMDDAYLMHQEEKRKT